MVKISLIIFLILLGFLGPQGQIIPVETFIIILLLAGSSLVFFIFCLVKWKFFEGDLFEVTSLSALFLLFLFWSALGYFYSADPERSVLISIQSLSAILLYLGLSCYVQENNQVTTILKFALIFLGIIALVGIAQNFNFPILKNSPTTNFINKNTGTITYEFRNHITSLFAHRNIFSGYLIFLIPIPCLIYLSNWSKLWNLIAAVVLVLSFIALGLSDSRGGLLVGIMQLIVIIGYLLFNKDSKALVHLTLGILISLTLYITINKIVNIKIDGTSVPPITTLVTNIIDHAGVQQSLKRILFWQGAWEIFKDHWLIGSGPLSFNLLFPKYYIYVTPLINNQTLTASPPHAHNIFIQTAAESGFIGIGLMLSFIAVFYRRAYKLYKSSTLKIRTAIFFITLAVTSFLLHNVIEYNWPGSMFIYNFTIFIFIINFIGRNQVMAGEIGPPSNRFYVVLGILAIFLNIKFSVQYYQFTNVTSDKSSNINNLNELTSNASQAKQICPRCDRPYIKLGSNILLRYKENNDDKLLVLAKKELLEGKKLNPYNPDYMGFLAQIFAIQGEYSRAQMLFKEALKFNRTHSIEKLGLSMEQLRKIDQAASNDK